MLVTLGKVALVLVVMLTVSFAKMFQSVSEEKATIVQDVKSKLYCQNCGMNLPKFYKTNHVHKDKQYCSLHCLVASTDHKLPSDAKVVDTQSLKFIDAKKAYYVVGSTKRGTMTVNSKYAFLDREDAENFSKKYGGDIVNFGKAYDIAREDFSKDMSMIKAKKEKKIYKTGQMLEKKCEKVNLSLFSNIAQLKAKLKSSCKLKKDKQLQAVAIYLWDTQKNGKKIDNSTAINVPKDAKCPVCGMFVSKYAKWAAVIEGDKNYYFDGVKDMMKYVLREKEVFEKVYVSDYFSTKKIDAKNAYFVIGSNIYGPMGKEIIPFSKREDAEEFKKDHFGKKILVYNQITEDIVELL